MDLNDLFRVMEINNKIDARFFPPFALLFIAATVLRFLRPVYANLAFWERRMLVFDVQNRTISQAATEG